MTLNAVDCATFLLILTSAEIIHCFSRIRKMPAFQILLLKPEDIALNSSSSMSHASLTLSWKSWNDEVPPDGLVLTQEDVSL